jgi:hypothetical protein
LGGEPFVGNCYVPIGFSAMTSCLAGKVI